MTYYPDLTPYQYIRPEPNTVNIGWLSRAVEYEQGPSPSEFLERLTLFCKNPPDRYMTRGYHTCEFCGRFVGGSEIRIPTPEKIYAAPVLVFHYVEAHNYRPPQEFIDAVLAAPLPHPRESLLRYGRPNPHPFPEEDEGETGGPGEGAHSRKDPLLPIPGTKVGGAILSWILGSWIVKKLVKKSGAR